MENDADAIHILDPATERLWTIPRDRVTSIVADVSERWIANVIIPEEYCRALIPAPFLEPVPTRAGYLLSLCAIFMRHAAPQWAPLSMGPASRNCALRIACRNRRTGQPAVWVDHRYSDSILVTALAKLGFPEVKYGLRVDFRQNSHGHQHIVMDTQDGQALLELGEAPEHDTALHTFATASDFEDYFIAGVRSYGPGEKPGQATMVDLHKRSDNHFQAMQQLTGTLKTTWGTWEVDGVYRTCNGIYEWRYEGDVTY